jgi:hypothetical protein
MKVAMSDIDLDELRSELDDFADPEKKGGRSPREERIIAVFEEIQRFVEKHGRAPEHGEAPRYLLTSTCCFVLGKK